MAKIPISKLPKAISVGANDEVPVVQDGVTKKVAIEDIGKEINEAQEYSGLDSTDKTIIGAINEISSSLEGKAEASNVYTKEETYNKIELDTKVHDAVVEELEENGASETGYDNTESGLEATNVQDAIDEVNTKIENIPSVDAYTKEQSDEKYATKTELSNKADVSAIPTKTSQLQNDSGFATMQAVGDNYYNKTQTNNLLNDKASASEVENIRIGANGFTFSNAGEAVREQLDDIQKALGVNIIKGQPTIISEDHYINTSGVNISNTAFDVYGNIKIYKGMSIKVYAEGYLTAVAIICLTDELGTTFSPVVNSIDSTARYYTYEAISDCYIAISSKNTTVPSYEVTAPSIYPEIEKIVYNKASISYDIIANHYIRYDGVIMSSNNWCYSEPIRVYKGEIISLIARGYLDSNAMISTCDSNGAQISPKVISDGSVIKNYTYFVEEDGYIIVSYLTYYFNTLYRYNKDSLVALNERVNKLENNSLTLPLNILTAFDNITCIGDSLTWSQVYTGNNANRQAFVPYPKALARKTGAEYQILAFAGATAITCWNSFKDQVISRTNDLTIIYLGTNEGLTDTIDTDCSGDDYTTYANTNTGKYGAFIKKSLSLGNRVILIKVYASSGNVETTNDVIEKMGARFNVPFIENPNLTDLKYHSYPDGTGQNGVHYNDFGYSAFADQVVNNISKLSTYELIKIIPN